MKNRVLTALLAVAALFVTATQVSQAQYIPEPLVKGQGVGVAISGTSAYAPILIRYVGSSPAGGTVTVAANGDITLKTGPVGTSVADVTTECPVSGALGGIIDVSDAACNTLGEVVDAINGSANWRAVIQDGVRGDDADSGGNGTLITLAETSATLPQGLALAGDSTVALNAQLLLMPTRSDIRFYIGSQQPFNLNPNPFINSQTIVWRWNQTLTGTGADNTDLIFDVPNNQRCTLTASAVSCTASAVTTTAYTEPGGTTGVNKAFDFSRVGFWGPYGGRVLVKGRFATTLTAVNNLAAGAHYFSYPSGRR